MIGRTVWVRIACVLFAVLTLSLGAAGAASAQDVRRPSKEFGDRPVPPTPEELPPEKAEAFLKRFCSQDQKDRAVEVFSDAVRDRQEKRSKAQDYVLTAMPAYIEKERRAGFADAAASDRAALRAFKTNELPKFIEIVTAAEGYLDRARAKPVEVCEDATSRPRAPKPPPAPPWPKLDTPIFVLTTPFCTEPDRNDFLNKVMNPAINRAKANVAAAKAHLARLNALVVDAQNRGAPVASIVVLREEIAKYAQIAKGVSDEAQRLQDQSQTALHQPLIDCGPPVKISKIPPRPGLEGPLELGSDPRFCTKAQRQAYLDDVVEPLQLKAIRNAEATKSHLIRLRALRHELYASLAKKEAAATSADIAAIDKELSEYEQVDRATAALSRTLQERFLAAAQKPVEPCQTPAKPEDPPPVTPKVPGGGGTTKPCPPGEKRRGRAPTRAGTAACPPLATASPMASSFVAANNSGTTDLGVFPAGTYTIRASGIASMGGGRGAFDMRPDGVPNQPVTAEGYSYFNPAGTTVADGIPGPGGRGINIGALMGSFVPVGPLGDNAAPRSTYFLIGNVATVSHAGGHIYAQVNDTFYSNDTGGYAVTVRQAPPPSVAPASPTVPAAPSRRELPQT